MKMQDHESLIYSGIWVIMLILVLMFWPKSTMKPVEPIEPQVIIKNHYIYVEKVVEVADLPEEVVFEEPIVSPRYGFTEDDIYLMTVLLCGSGDTSGDGEYDIDFGNQDNHEQISLVLSVVMNRVMSDKFPNTVAEVIWAPNQFSPMKQWKHNLPTVKPESYAVVEAWCKAYDAYDLKVMTIPENHVFFTGNGVINKSRGGF